MIRRLIAAVAGVLLTVGLLTGNGPWVKASSGKPSYTAWVAWPYRTNDQGRKLQTK